MAEFYRIDDDAAANRAIQTRLRRIARSDGDIPSVYIDGIYGEETANAVSAFQRKHGLPVTGTVDIWTHRAIIREYDALLLRDERLGGSPDFDRLVGGVISGGDDFDGVLALQLLFRSIAEQDDRFSVPRDGVYGEKTADAVRFFNRLRGREEDGAVDRVFWNELVLFSERYVDQ